MTTFGNINIISRSYIPNTVLLLNKGASRSDPVALNSSHSTSRDHGAYLSSLFVRNATCLLFVDLGYRSTATQLKELQRWNMASCSTDYQIIINCFYILLYVIYS